MSNDRWNYGDAFKRVDMSGVVKVGDVTLKVHDIFEPLPDFMHDADCVFCDPPCSLGNINTFYTKAGRSDYQSEYDRFATRFFECVDEVAPRHLFVEVFKSNKAQFEAEIIKRYKSVHTYEVTYYKRNKCWIIAATNDGTRADALPFEGMDEEDCIAWICEHDAFGCIGDWCMGRGLVAQYGARFGRRVVGTELNEKRLAVAVERAEKEARKKGKKVLFPLADIKEICYYIDATGDKPLN